MRFPGFKTKVHGIAEYKIAVENMAKNRGTRTALPPPHFHTPKTRRHPSENTCNQKERREVGRGDKGRGGREGGRYQEELNSLNDLRTVRVDNWTMISPGVKTHKVLVEQVA